MSLDPKTLAALRQQAREEAKRLGPAAAHRNLSLAVVALLEDFRAEFDVPGVRYWETYFDPDAPVNHRGHFTTMLRDYDPLSRPKDHTIVELNRMEFFARQGARGYDDLL